MSRREELTDLLQKAADAYYNTGNEIMSNKEYDALFDELKNLEEKEGITKGFTSRVGIMSKKLQKVKHEYEAKSLDKTKSIDEMVAIQSKGNRGEDTLLCLSWKMDGSTVQLTYEDGHLVTAATRGDGQVGQDITRNAPFIDGIPLSIPYYGKVTIRGEVTMSYEEFDRLNEKAGGIYANPRNLANATITAEDREIIKDRRTKFRPFELVHTDAISGIFDSFSESLDYLRNYGFDPVEHEVVTVRNLKDAIKRWSEKERIDLLLFPVDGLVVAGDDMVYTRTLEGTGHHPNRLKGMAFKWQDETRETTLRKIEWQVGRTGVLTPVAVFDEVDLEGTKVSKASLHNLSYVKAKDLRIGDRITIYKANMIIPQVDENLTSTEERRNDGYGYDRELPEDMTCPCCSSKIRVNDNNGIETLVCENEKCFAKMIAVFEHAYSKDGLNVEGLSESTIEFLLQKGLLQTPADLYHLTEEDFKENGTYFAGFGKRSVENLLTAIEKSRNTDAAHFLYACGIPGFGRGQIKPVLKFIRENEDCIQEALKYDCKTTLDYMQVGNVNYACIEGIGPIISANIEEFLSKFTEYDNEWAALERELNVERDLSLEKKKEEGSKALEGKTFCITGSLNHFENRDAAFAWIEENGGKTSTSVSSKTSYLVNNDVTSTSGKNKKAKELGIPIISEEELLSMGKTVSLEEEKEYE